MITVIRTSPEGYKGYKHFETMIEARQWLNTPAVEEDIEYGYHFTVVEE